MPNLKPRMRNLLKYALAKRGALLGRAGDVDVLQYPHVSLPGTTWGQFFDVEQENERDYARIPVLKDALARHRESYPAIRESGWVERDGHVMMEVPLDANLPIGLIKSFIDEAYEIVWNKLDEKARLMIEWSQLPYDERKLMDRLIDLHNLAEHRKSIRKMARHAILLRTRESSEAKIPLGATKLGGRPDLPAKAEWPTYRDGKPLAFLAQINLKEIATLGSPIKGLPSDGLLSIFSVWGWQDKDDLDPHTPDDGTSRDQEENGWTLALHTPRRAKLERRKIPRGLLKFRAAAVELIPILSLPNHDEDMPESAKRWTEADVERFDEMQSDYRSLQMYHWLRNRDSFTSHHLLGGYALFQQCYPEELPEKDLTMLLQLGTDWNTGWCWSDGGELAFYADRKALAKGRFERLWGECQGG